MSNKKVSILVVEDDQFLAEMYSTKLGLEGFDVMMAGDGQQALDTLAKNQPDLVILDLMLPKVDGFAVLEAMHADTALARIPVIVLSNLGEKESVDRALSLGANDYLIKAHFLPTEVVTKIRKTLGI